MNIYLVVIFASAVFLIFLVIFFIINFFRAKSGRRGLGLFTESFYVSLREIFYKLHFPALGREKTAEELKEEYQRVIVQSSKAGLKGKKIEYSFGESKGEKNGIEEEAMKKESGLEEMKKEELRKKLEEEIRKNPPVKKERKKVSKDIKKAGSVNQEPDGKESTEVQKDTGMIKLASFNDLLDRVKNENLKNILGILKNKNIEFINKIVSEKIFKSEEDIMQFLREEIINFLNDIYSNLKYKISEFRKKGKDVGDIRVKSMSIPLKIKIFTVSFSNKDFENVIKIIDLVENDLKKLETPKEEIKETIQEDKKIV